MFRLCPLLIFLCSCALSWSCESDGNWFEGLSHQEIPFSSQVLRRRHQFILRLFLNALGQEHEVRARSYLTGIFSDSQPLHFVLRHLTLLGKLYALGVIQFRDYQQILRGYPMSPALSDVIMVRLKTVQDHLPALIDWAKNIDARWPDPNHFLKYSYPQPYTPHRILKGNKADLGVWEVSLSLGTLPGLIPSRLALKASRWSSDLVNVNRERFSRAEAFVGHLLIHPELVSPLGYIRFGSQDMVLTPMMPSGDILVDLADQGLPKKELLKYFLTGVRKIQLAHNLGIHNFDVKPDHIYVSKHGEVFVFDFGVCSFHQPHEKTVNDLGWGPWYAENFSGLTHTPFLDSHFLRTFPYFLGTFPYIAPEIMAGGMNAHSEASTVFSLGMSLYYLLTSDPRFEADMDRPGEIRQVYESLRTTPLLDQMDRIDPRFSALFRDATQFNLRNRILTLEEFRTRLEDILDK